MFHRGSLGIAPAAAFAAWLACGLPETALAVSDAPDAAAAALIVLPGARDVHRSTRESARGIRYRLQADFPAAGPILDLAKRLERRGWIRLGENPRNGGTPTLPGWTTFVDPSAATMPFQTWTAANASSAAEQHTNSMLMMKWPAGNSL